MSTRCQIGFYESKEKSLEDFEALIYRHSDGYPDTEHGVVKAIAPFLKWWKSQRGIDDLEYLSARLLQWLCNNYDGKGYGHFKEGDNEYTGIYGHGICKDFHGDIEYFYKIYPNAIEVYKVGNIWDKFDEKEFKLIKTVKI
jgi:hypothetical protein